MRIVSKTSLTKNPDAYLRKIAEELEKIPEKNRVYSSLNINFNQLQTSKNVYSIASARFEYVLITSFTFLLRFASD